MTVDCPACDGGREYPRHNCECCHGSGKVERGKVPDPAADGPDVTALRAAIAKADALVAHYHSGITLAQSLKRTLVLRLLQAQFPNLTVHEQAKLMRSYGVEP